MVGFFSRCWRTAKFNVLVIDKNIKARTKVIIESRTVIIKDVEGWAKWNLIVKTQSLHGRSNKLSNLVSVIP